MWYHTKITELLGIDYPILQGPFGGNLSTPALVATVSNAGGLGGYGAYTLSPQEIVDNLLAVIKMHTINAAYQLHMERATGSIEVGKYADLVILDQNLFEIPTERISETSVVKTILGGKVVYSAD